MKREKRQRTNYLEGWKIYPAEAFGHHVQGFLVSLAIVHGPDWRWVFGAGLWAILYVAYQGLSVIRKRDSAGLDVMDLMTGMVIAMAVSLLLHKVGIAVVVP